MKTQRLALFLEISTSEVQSKVHKMNVFVICCEQKHTEYMHNIY